MAIAETAYPTADRDNNLLQHYIRVRQQSELLCQPLQTEDYVVQSMPDVSPSKWHLAHVSWFFESFILKQHQADYQPFDSDFDFLFNSYYISKGQRHARPQRGLLSRPTVDKVFEYRKHVDAAMTALIENSPSAELAFLMTLGLHHEQQHQELLLMDIKHVFSCNPLLPQYSNIPLKQAPASEPLQWQPLAAGIYEIGQSTDTEAFCYDNETPRHRELVNGCQIANRCVSNFEWLAFINDGGYQDHRLWLSDGWDWLQQQAIQAPLYWQQDQTGQWQVFTLHGLQPIDPNAAVCHISFYEAEAYASWAGARLPLEAEWEALFSATEISGQFVESEQYQPLAANSAFGGVWQWMRSNYSPYPGFKALAGSVGEYNGKFMNSQYVLRGGSCLTPEDHIRASYRNFFYPHMRWQMAGLRLARDV